MACELPVASGVPLSRWSSAELAREAIGRGIVEQISDVTVWRWLSQDAISRDRVGHAGLLSDKTLGRQPLQAFWSGCALAR